MSQSTVGERNLPDNGNVSQGFDKDIDAIVAAMRSMSEMNPSTSGIALAAGAGAPSNTPSTASLYIRNNGTSVSSLYFNIGGTSVWNRVTATA